MDSNGPKLLVTTVIHGAAEGKPHGGAYLVNLAKQEVFKPLEYDNPDIEWFGDEGGRGLRGIALDGATVYLAAADRLLAYDRDFNFIDCWQSANLANCRGIAIHERELFLVSSGNDSILAFDLERKKFHWAMHVQTDHFQFRPAVFDPLGSDGPIPIDKLKLRNIHSGKGGLYFAGLNTGGLLHFNGEKIQMLAELPRGAQDPHLFRNGIVFNDSHAGVLRYAGDDDGNEDRALKVPFFEETDHDRHDSSETRQQKRGYGRGLCVLSGSVVAGGSTPAGVSVYDLRQNRKLASVWFTKNTHEAVNCIEAWLD